MCEFATAFYSRSGRMLRSATRADATRPCGHAPDVSSLRPLIACESGKITQLRARRRVEDCAIRVISRDQTAGWRHGGRALFSG